MTGPRDFAFAVMLAALSDPPATEPFKIVTMGTSLTSEGGWQEALRDTVSGCLGRKVSIINIAEAGANSRRGLAQAEIAIELKPDLVTVEFAINDASMLRGISKREASDNLAKVTNLLKEKGVARVVLMTMNPTWGLRGWVRPSLRSYYAEVGEVAERTGSYFVDLVQQWEMLSEERFQEALPDGLHPTKSASTEVIVPPLARSICDVVGRSPSETPVAPDQRGDVQ